MSSAKIRNFHERRISADLEVVWDLLMAMPGPDGRLWPPGIPTHLKRLIAGPPLPYSSVESQGFWGLSGE